MAAALTRISMCLQFDELFRRRRCLDWEPPPDCYKQIATATFEQQVIGRRRQQQQQEHQACFWL
jgi:hypothetical protein